MRKKMRKYQPGGTNVQRSAAGPPNTIQPIDPTSNIIAPPQDVNPVNANQPTAPEAPVTPITSGETAQAPVMDPLLAANEKYAKLGYNPRKARRLAMKEVNPLNKKKVSGADVLNTISSGLDAANKTAGTIGAIRSAFQKNGGQMGGKQLRKTSGFMESGGSVNKPMNMKKKTKTANKAAKKYGQATTAYSKGNSKKGDRKKAKGDALLAKSRGVMKYGGTKRRKK